MAPYLQILLGLSILAAIYADFKCLLKNLHMFQLNSYRYSTHFHWMGKNIKRYFPEGIAFVLSLTGIITNQALMFFAAVALLISIIAVLISNKNVPMKKPLVYTPRVKRMTVTALILYALNFAAMVFALLSPCKNLAFLTVGMSAALTPLYVLLANLINTPIEKGINRHYLNDAKKMLSESPSLEVMGITGSFGKTSVKFYLYAILRSWTDTLVTPESYNTPMGVVKTVRGELNAFQKIFLCEMGAKWIGDIKELCDIVHPEHGIITSLGEQHLESFGSLQNIINTKYELSDALPENGRLYINYDNEIIRKNPPAHKFITYGTGEDCDYKATVKTVGRTGTSFSVRFPDGNEYDFETQLLGGHNVVNLTGAIAAANGFGMSAEEIKIPVRRIEPVEHRMKLIDKGAVVIIDDAYNSNPAGCAAALGTLRMFDDMKILVTPGMVELGSREDELNREFGVQAAKACDIIVLVGARQTAAIADGVKSASFPEKNLYIAENLDDAMKYVYSIKTEKKKIVLLENDLPDNY